MKGCYKASWYTCGGEGIMLQCKKEAMKRWHKKGNAK